MQILFFFKIEKSNISNQGWNTWIFYHVSAINQTTIKSLFQKNSYFIEIKI